MITLDASLHIPANISFSVVGQDAFLLNTITNKYFALEDVGTRMWELLKEGNPLRECVRILADEYEVTPGQLEQDILELMQRLLENGLVELDQT
ncbi:MAG: PqqD family protein [Chloroflexi bacterium]|nr:PqqD family protein [Chloroflexota bacterium]